MATRRRVAARKPARAKPARRVRALSTRLPTTMVVQSAPPPRRRRPIARAIGRGLLGGLRGALTGLPGGLPGVLRGAAMGAISSAMGSGDYKVQSNTLMGSLAADPLPQFGEGQAAGCVRIRHREYIQDVVSSATASAFSVSSFPIQPAVSFPWLNAVAENFQEYKIHGMIAEFKTTSSDALNSTNTALGTVVISTRYNALEAAPVNKQQMEQKQYVTSAKPSLSFMHPIECKRDQSMMAVLSTRPGPVSTGDLRLYDFGIIDVATVGVQGTSVNLGEFWISYDIELLKPKLGSAADQADHYNSNGTGASTSAYFGNPIATVSATSDLGTTITNTTIVLPNSFTGNILVFYYFHGTGGSGVPPNFTPSAGASALSNILTPGSSQINMTQVTVQGGITIATYACVNGGTITLSGGTFPTTTSDIDLLVTVLPSTLVS